MILLGVPYLGLESDYLLATAATNGAVVIWNLEREGYKHVQGGDNCFIVVLVEKHLFFVCDRARAEWASAVGEPHLLAHDGLERAH